MFPCAISMSFKLYAILISILKAMNMVILVIWKGFLIYQKHRQNSKKSLSGFFLFTLYLLTGSDSSVYECMLDIATSMTSVWERLGNKQQPPISNMKYRSCRHFVMILLLQHFHTEIQIRMKIKTLERCQAARAIIMHFYRSISEDLINRNE